jgi:hypothetical protein
MSKYFRFKNTTNGELLILVKVRSYKVTSGIKAGTYHSICLVDKKTGKQYLYRKRTKKLYEILSLIN